MSTTPGHWQRVFEGRHHAIFRFTQNYPRNCPSFARTIPVTIDWMFSTGHRLGDMRRLMRAPYNRTQTSVFPNGVFFKGGNYGPDVNFPVTQAEENNPNFKGCTDRAA